MFTKQLQVNLVARCLLRNSQIEVTKYYVNPKCTIDKRSTLAGPWHISLVLVTRFLSGIAHLKAQSLQISILNPIGSREISAKSGLHNKVPPVTDTPHRKKSKKSKLHEFFSQAAHRIFQQMLVILDSLGPKLSKNVQLFSLLGGGPNRVIFR